MHSLPNLKIYIDLSIHIVDTERGVTCKEKVYLDVGAKLILYPTLQKRDMGMWIRYTGSGRNTWRFGETIQSGIGVGEFVLERSTSETENISVAIERWSAEHRAFAVETIFKNDDSVLTQRIFRGHNVGST